MCKFNMSWFVCLALTARIALAAETTVPGEEEKLIAVLGSNQTLAEKDAACVRLKRIGTEKCIPALALLLSDTNLSHSARYALEPMPFAKAEEALLDASKKSSGAIRLGIISSLGIRRDPRAVRTLASLLNEADHSTANAAATALGQIGGSEALKALMKDSSGNNGGDARALRDGILRCANGQIAADPAQALDAFKKLYNFKGMDSGTRIAAYAGMITASGKDGLKLELAGLKGQEPNARLAALKMASTLGLPGTTKALAEALAGLDGHLQASVIEALRQRNDPSAAAQVAALADSPSPEVRLAVIQALGEIGDAGHVELLARFAAGSESDQQVAARQALGDLNRGNVTEALLKTMATSLPGVQAEIAAVLAQRNDLAAWPALLRIATQGNAASQKAALKALSLLADESRLPAMVQLVTAAADETQRSQAADALNRAYQRVQAKNGRVALAPLIAALNSGTPETKAALLPICSGFSAPESRAAIRAALADKNLAVRTAAIHALCDTSDVELLPDAERLATEAPDDSTKNLAIGACVRLTTPEEGARLTNAQRLEVLKAILATPLKQAQKRQILAGLAEIPELAAFKVAEPMITDSEVLAEAALAAIKIASRVGGPDAGETLPALQTISSSNAAENIRQLAAQTIKQIYTRADYVTLWQISGPYAEAGKDYSALFDVTFPPEKVGEAVTWKKIEPGTDAARPFVMDLLKALGGEQRVAYARTWIYCEEPQPIRLEIGSDDGVKVWLNHKLIHAHNVARALKEGSDKASATLEKGWNELLLKITQHNQGWEFCARILKPNGEHIEGLKVGLEPAQTAAKSP
jgi:HEAT repeat protein